MQEQMDNVSREIKTLRKNQKEMLEIKNIVTEMKSAFDGLIGRLDMPEERISVLEYVLIENFQTEKRQKK